MNLTEEQILLLAPDAASQKAGKDLAAPAKWVSKGTHEKALWGECQGSGSKPYQTAIDVSAVAFKCSCPSRKFPCKHGLGLLLYHVRKPADFTQNEMPAWVGEWIGKRTEKSEKAVDKKEAAVDEAAQAKRQQARHHKVATGIAELLFWLKDLVRNGILTMPEKGDAFFDGMARRMVDAQAPGLAAMIRNLGQVPFYKEGWQTGFVDGMVRLYLLALGYQHLAGVNEALQQDIRGLIGFTQSIETLKTEEGIKDDWLVLGRQTTEEDNLTIEQNWLYGTSSNRYALILQFLVRGQPGGMVITPGSCITAELVFYPSAAPLRAIIKQPTATLPVPNLRGFANWREVVSHQTTIHSVLPFSANRPYVIHQLTPVLFQNHWWLQDDQQQMMPLPQTFPIWKLLSMSGGQPLTIALTGKEMYYEPLGIWQHGNYKLL